MNNVISSEKIPIKLWLSKLDEKTLEQAKNLANLPFAFKHIAIMPDAHMGYGMPIGGVMATQGTVIPNAVGKDIGCGMLSIKTNLTKISDQVLNDIKAHIRKIIPMGFEWRKTREKISLMPDSDFDNLPVINKMFDKARYQLGTLGGGNHFIEIQKGEDGFIYFMIHSGSRNIGSKVADYHDKIAKKLNNVWYSGIDKKYDLAFLPLGTNEFKSYMAEMSWCIEFAKTNRHIIANKIKKIFSYYVNHVNFSLPIDISHNYARFENHFGNNVIVHRKGATSAKKGEIGIIPGSMGSNSYIVEGLGNEMSFNSCSHGAGRALGRKQAIRELDFDEEIKKLDTLGINHDMKDKEFLDEAPSAYKDIEVVMDNQSDLVKKIVTLKPLVVIKNTKKQGKT